MDSDFERQKTRAHHQKLAEPYAGPDRDAETDEEDA